MPSSVPSVYNLSLAPACGKKACILPRPRLVLSSPRITISSPYIVSATGTQPVALSASVSPYRGRSVPAISSPVVYFSQPSIVSYPARKDMPSPRSSCMLHSLITNLNKVTVSSSYLRRMARGFIRLALSPQSNVPPRPAMPDASAMASAVILTHGCVALTDCPLNPSSIYADHREHHLDCNSSCYIHRLVAVARYGFEIRKDAVPGVRSPKSRLFNHPPFNLFGSLSDAALSKQIIQSGACRLLPPGSAKSSRRSNLIFSPLLTLIRNSDLWRAAAVGVEVVDEQSLVAVNAVLDPPIKLRACIDLASSGINELQPNFPFAYCSLDDALALVNPGCWMAKIDLQGMFHSIGLSHASRKYFCFHDRTGSAHQYIRACFGGKLFPAIASAFMAEVMFIARSLKVDCVSYVDDFFVTGISYAECLSKRNIIIDILVRHGWTINFDKVTDPSQILDFLGTVIDSQKMIVSVSPEKAACVAFKLERVWAMIPEDPTAAAKLLHSLLGSLVWFSSVVSCGRL